ncbi:alpha-amylase family glycosyl hydrolase [Geotalea sp. SG265]|uniref:alpha-amylase family glycosyl hydrolase n=1 Tax=Geotalea sp. SG265 TaxID=2922867 RepID=UPI001FAFAFC5|nr:alpha-amylase family glycosyl hydrolase [Geotalea sp. SG265]
MSVNNKKQEYFPFGIQIEKRMWQLLDLDKVAEEVRSRKQPHMVFIRQLANRLNRQPARREQPVSAGQLNLYAMLEKIYRYVFDLYAVEQFPAVLDRVLGDSGYPAGSPQIQSVLIRFAEHLPGASILEKKEDAAGYVSADADGRRRALLLKELLLLRLSGENQALDQFREIFDAPELQASDEHNGLEAALDQGLAGASPMEPFGIPLPALLRAPMLASPFSLPGQIDYIRENWRSILPPDLLAELLTAMDIAQEEEREFWGGPGRPQVLEFLKGKRLGKEGYEYPEYDRFSPDAEWMANVVMMAKMVYVWLDQLSKKYGRAIYRLDHIPDEELDILARWGFSGLWLIGLWERSPASQRIKQIAGNPDAFSSAYSLYDYVIAHDLGGDEALANLKERCRQRGIRLASDMVPNHTGLYSRWTVEHPDWFVQLDYPPYPAYSFNGPDLSSSPEVSLHIEDGYWTKTDAAVVFKHYDHRDGRTRYIYHGNDGTSTPWNDTAQLNYLLPQVREAVVQTILHVARQFPIIRFDAAMTLAKKHYQRLWYPQPGHGSGVPSRSEHGMSREDFDAAFPVEFWREVVDRVAAEAPGTLLLAEAFWLMEGYFVRTLGMHRVYNSAFMNMLKMEENAKYRQTIKNVLEYDHRILPRFVNFMNNPDEKTAVEQFGREGKYYGACVLLVTMPGLPMIGHGQVEGFREKYGMEYRHAHWDEQVDEHMVRMHEEKIFPLMGKRWLFSGSENFVLYDFFAGGHVNEDVYAYSNLKGCERGIILYHNKYAETAGWIRTSTAIGVKGADGETVLVQKNLGEALCFNGDGRCYYIFRDYASGLEYIRSGRELCDSGLYVELKAFEYHAFLDFREIWDDEYGTWGRLCHSLNGNPVRSMDEEVKQVRYKGLNSHLRELLALQAAKEEAPEKSADELFRNRLTAFLVALSEHLGAAGRYERLVVPLAAQHAFLQRLTAPKTGDVPVDEPLFQFGEVMGTRVGGLISYAFICLHATGMLADEKDYPRLSAEFLSRFGLYRPVEESFQIFSEDAWQPFPGLDSATAVCLIRVMIEHQQFLAIAPEPGGERGFAALLEENQARGFLLINRSNGHEWFNKERFEMLMTWLGIAALLEVKKEIDPSELMARAKTLQKEITKITGKAQEAGFEVKAFLALTKPADVEE